MIVPKKNEEMARALGCRKQNFRWDSPTLDPPTWVSNEREASGELVCFCRNLPIPKSFNVKWIGAKPCTFYLNQHVIMTVPHYALVWQYRTVSSTITFKILCTVVCGHSSFRDKARGASPGVPFTWRNRRLPSPPQINLSVCLSVCPSVISLLIFLRIIALAQQIW